MPKLSKEAKTYKDSLDATAYVVCEGCGEPFHAPLFESCTTRGNYYSGESSLKIMGPQKTPSSMDSRVVLALDHCCEACVRKIVEKVRGLCIEK
jgi:hypothetical protein